ncbi:hypothetical protein [Rhodoferax koreensis]|uniref:hypothetical protein n=1 Tax=Rhodoferax koreensis TaxID=1842727 RepID=UPI0012FFA3EF|nr:hypothetical protein [Rhodoferax koreense]
MSEWADLSTELLPQVLQDFVRLIGLPATMLVVERHGGRRLYIPHRATPDPHSGDALTALALKNATTGTEGPSGGQKKPAEAGFAGR